MPSAGAMGAAAGLQAADSFSKVQPTRLMCVHCKPRVVLILWLGKLSAYVQPSLVYCQREADRLYAAWREQQDLSAQSQAGITQ